MAIMNGRRKKGYNNTLIHQLYGEVTYKYFLLFDVGTSCIFFLFFERERERETGGERGRARERWRERERGGEGY